VATYTWGNLDVPIKRVDTASTRLGGSASVIPGTHLSAGEVKALEAAKKEADATGRIFSPSVRWDLFAGTVLRPHRTDFDLNWLQWIPAAEWFAWWAPWQAAGYSFVWGRDHRAFSQDFQLLLNYQIAVRQAVPAVYLKVDREDRVVEGYLLVTRVATEPHVSYIVQRLLDLRAQLGGLPEVQWATKSGFWRHPTRVLVGVIPTQVDEGGPGMPGPYGPGEWEHWQAEVLRRLMDAGVAVVTSDRPAHDTDPNGNNVPWQWLQGSQADLPDRLVGERQ
jgi:hypothetical protein